MISAGILASLTLSVFSRLQDYGPESAIRRFNEAVKPYDPDELKKVTADDARREEVEYLLSYLTRWYDEGATMHLAQMERTDNEVRAAVLFSFPPGPMHLQGTQMPMIWVVVRKGKVWLVDANKTATILRDNLGRLIRQG